MSELRQLQAWFKSHCDGDWEHGNGVRIETLDNSGWSVSINLDGTDSEDGTFVEVVDSYNHDTNWIRLLALLGIRSIALVSGTEGAARKWREALETSAQGPTVMLAPARAIRTGVGVRASTAKPHPGAPATRVDERPVRALTTAQGSG